MNKLELLSPAGDINIFKSVVNAGADAVYFGGDLFGARAFAKNFTIQEAEEAIKYAHVHSAKAYLTVNTLLKNREIENDLYSYLKDYVNAGIDAFIVQDFGVLQLIKEHFPDVDIHASTQMSLCTAYGAKMLEDVGASRIVTARELSLSEISNIHGKCPDLEIESFIHGALCVCYSGQCLMSSIIGGRSGNRGRCAQPCRLPYKAYYNGKNINSKGDYILSPKDFCTIEYLPEMIKAGVMSFKIEGRMKQLSYATGVVSVYRYYLDQYLYKGEKNYNVSDKDIQKLLDFGNRSGFTDLYLNKHNGPEMITFEEPSHSKKKDETVIANEKKLILNCNVEALLGKPLCITFEDENGNLGLSRGPIVEKANNRPSEKEDIIKSVSQIGDTNFVLNRINVEYDDEIFLPVSWLKQTRREAIADLYDKLVPSTEKRVLPLNNIEEHKNLKCNHKIGVSISNLSQFGALKDFDFIDELYVPLKIYDGIHSKWDKKLFVSLPSVIRNKDIELISIPKDADGILVSSYDGLGLLESVNYPKNKVYFDHRLYTFSNRAIDAFLKLGYSHFCAPYELSLKELNHRNNTNSQMIIYSKIPLMITANCTIKNTIGCKKENTLFNIIDRKNEQFDVLCDCDYCYNTIYNGKKYVAFGLKDELNNLGMESYRMDFSIESADEVRKICNLYQSVFIENENYMMDEQTTKGHLKRGVE